MNWVGGARNRIKIKNEQKKQREFFKNRRQEVAQDSGRLKSVITPSLSRDLLTFNLLRIKSRNSCKMPNPTKVIKHDLEKFNAGKILYVDIPETPLHTHAIPRSKGHYDDELKKNTKRSINEMTERNDFCSSMIKRSRRRLTDIQKLERDDIEHQISDENSLKSNKCDTLKTLKNIQQLEMYYRNVQNKKALENSINNFTSYEKFDERNNNCRDNFVGYNESNVTKENLKNSGFLFPTPNNSICTKGFGANFNGITEERGMLSKKLPRDNFEFEPCLVFGNTSPESDKHFKTDFQASEMPYNETVHSIGKESNFEAINPKNTVTCFDANSSVFPEDIACSSTDSLSSSPSPASSSYILQHASISDVRIKHSEENFGIFRNVNEKKRILRTSKSINREHIDLRKHKSAFDYTCLKTYDEISDAHQQFEIPKLKFPDGNEDDLNQDLEDYSVFQENIYLFKKSKHYARPNIFSKNFDTKRSELHVTEDAPANHGSDRYNSLGYKNRLSKEASNSLGENHLDDFNIYSSRFDELASVFTVNNVARLRKRKYRTLSPSKHANHREKIFHNREIKQPGERGYHMDSCETNCSNIYEENSYFSTDNNNSKNNCYDEHFLTDTKSRLKILPHTNSHTISNFSNEGGQHENKSDLAISSKTSMSYFPTVRNSQTKCSYDKELSDKELSYDKEMSDDKEHINFKRDNGQISKSCSLELTNYSDTTTSEKADKFKNTESFRQNSNTEENIFMKNPLASISSLSRKKFYDHRSIAENSPPPSIHSNAEHQSNSRKSQNKVPKTGNQEVYRKTSNEKTDEDPLMQNTKSVHGNNELKIRNAFASTFSREVSIDDLPPTVPNSPVRLSNIKVSPKFERAYENIPNNCILQGIKNDVDDTIPQITGKEYKKVELIYDDSNSPEETKLMNVLDSLCFGERPEYLARTVPNSPTILHYVDRALTISENSVKTILQNGILQTENHYFNQSSSENVIDTLKHKETLKKITKNVKENNTKTGDVPQNDNIYDSSPSKQLCINREKDDSILSAGEKLLTLSDATLNTLKHDLKAESEQCSKERINLSSDIISERRPKENTTMTVYKTVSMFVDSQKPNIQPNVHSEKTTNDLIHSFSNVSQTSHASGKIETVNDLNNVTTLNTESLINSDSKGEMDIEIYRVKSNKKSLPQIETSNLKDNGNPQSYLTYDPTLENIYPNVSHSGSLSPDKPPGGHISSSDKSTVLRSPIINKDAFCAKPPEELFDSTNVEGTQENKFHTIDIGTQTYIEKSDFCCQTML